MFYKLAELSNLSLIDIALKNTQKYIGTANRSKISDRQVM